MFTHSQINLHRKRIFQPPMHLISLAESRTILIIKDANTYMLLLNKSHKLRATSSFLNGYGGNHDTSCINSYIKSSWVMHKNVFCTLIINSVYSNILTLLVDTLSNQNLSWLSWFLLVSWCWKLLFFKKNVSKWLTSVMDSQHTNTGIVLILLK